jgi:hypothetical protein
MRRIAGNVPLNFAEALWPVAWLQSARADWFVLARGCKNLQVGP